MNNSFPAFSIIKDNILFWEKVYSLYSENTAVLHDKDNLALIYETVPLVDRNLPGAGRVNNAYLNAEKNKYSTILTKLAQGAAPASPVEARIYSMFSPPNMQNKFKEAANNIRVQTGLKENFIEGVRRSGAYIEEMKKIFKAYGLPEDLVYLAHVESSFNYMAYSKYGAAGIWQFTQSTGKNFLTIDYEIDERRDPIIATHAAAQYLKRNYEVLGTWPLAITAYNYGHAGMQRAVEQHGDYEKILRNYDQGYFKFASKNFYAEFLAALHIAKKLENDISIAKDKPRKNFTLKLKEFAHVNDIATYFNVAHSLLKELNPSLRQPVWLGEKYIPKEYLLQLPHGKNTIQLAGNIPNSLLHQQQKQSNYYKVKLGDTAGKIARMHRVSIKELSQANNLDKNAAIFIGQMLRIPTIGKATSGSAVPTIPKILPLHDQHQSIPILEADKKIASPLKKAPLQASASYEMEVISTTLKQGILHGDIEVLPEESIGIYAEWLKISENTLYRLNSISEEKSILPGQKLTLIFSHTTPQIFEQLRKDFHQETEQDFFNAYRITGFKHYKVALGDTLWDICQNKFDLPLWLLKKYNAELNFDRLNSSQKLKIPVVEAL